MEDQANEIVEKACALDIPMSRNIRDQSIEELVQNNNRNALKSLSFMSDNKGSEEANSISNSNTTFNQIAKRRQSFLIKSRTMV